MKKLLSLLTLPLLLLLLTACNSGGPLIPPTDETEEEVTEDTIEDVLDDTDDVEDTEEETDEETPENTEEIETDAKTDEEQTVSVSAPQYADYTANASLIGSQPIALFFHAEWCPTCRSMEEDINSNLASLTPGVTILKASYDDETELKQTYGITTQSTVVIINAAGEKIEILAAPSASEISEALATLL